MEKSQVVDVFVVPRVHVSSSLLSFDSLRYVLAQKSMDDMKAAEEDIEQDLV